MKRDLKYVIGKIKRLRRVQELEKSRNFPNGELWNKCEDTISNLKSSLNIPNWQIFA